MNFGFFELFGDVDFINQEVVLYQEIIIEDLYWAVNVIFIEENCLELFYKAKFVDIM